MMVTIHGLPIGVKYKDVKQLIKDKCTIEEFILDNLMVDNDQRSKMIRVGLSDTTEGAVVMTQLDGIWFMGQQLSVVPFTKSKPIQQQDNRGPNYQNQPGPNNSQNYGPRSQNRPNDVFGPSHNDGPDFRPQGPDRSNYGPQRNDGRPDFRRPDGNQGNQQVYRPNEDRNTNFTNPNNNFDRPRSDNSEYCGPEHQHRMEHNRTPARHIIGGRGPQENAPLRQDQNQGPPRREGPFQDHVLRSQGPGAHDPWASNTVQWSSNAIDEPTQHYQGQKNDFDLGPQPPIRVRDFNNQERFPANVPQQQTQDSWLPNNAGMPDPRATIMPQRVVEVTDSPIVRQHHDPNNVQARMGKPMTISKDKFQGPSQYSFEPEPTPPFRGLSVGSTQPPVPVWNTQAQAQNPALPQQRNPFDHNAPFTGAPEVSRFIDKQDVDNRFRNTGPEDGRGDYRRSPLGKRYQSPGQERPYSPPRRRNSPSGDGRAHRSPLRRSPTGRKGFSPGRKAGSPVQRVVSPGVRLLSPSRRVFEANRRGISPNRRISPPGRRISPPGRRISPPGRRISPPGRRISPPGRRGSPTERRITPTARRLGSPRRLSPQSRKLSPRRSRFSPPRFSPGRKSISPVKRGFSPLRRGISPSRRGVSPIKRGMSPVNRGRLSPNRGISPLGRGISPLRRGISPLRRGISPPRRLISPGRRLSPERRRSPGRYSPSSVYDDIPTSPKGQRFQKDIRPAYEPTPALPKLSSNYRPSVNQNVTYPIHGHSDSKPSSWQPNFVKDERRPPLEKRPSDSRVDWEPKRSRSRSPMRRDRSSRDRFRRSPSPQTSKVWKKRDSPDAPPPPAWPGAASEMPKPEKGKREPIWEILNSASKDDRKAPREDPFRRSMPQPSKPHWDMTKQHRPEENIQERRKISSPFVDNFHLEEDEKRHDFRRQEMKASAPLSRFDRREPMPHEESQRSAKGDNSDRHSFDKHSKGRADSYLHDRAKPHSSDAKPDGSDRKQAVDIISASLYDKYNIVHRRAREEMNLQLSKIVLEITGNKQMVSDDIVMKFYQNFSNQQQEKIVGDVMASLPSHLRGQKRIGEDIPAVAAKNARTDADLNSFMTQEQLPASKRRRRSVSRHSAEAHKSQPKELSTKPHTAASRNQSSTPKAKTKEPSRNIEDRLSADKLTRASRNIEDRPTKDMLTRALKAEVASSAYYELSPTMSGALNEELNIIMEKIEQVLPKTASNPTQKYVLDKIKQEVCADFCNVLSLNVAKRTLNVHNGLYVKIKFNHQVPANVLRSLKKQYNIIQVKAVANAPTTYLAVVKNFADFDGLCRAKDCKIDDYKFNTTPCYKFTKCTDNLKHGTFVKRSSTDMTAINNEEKTLVAQKTPQQIVVAQKTPQKTVVAQKPPQKTGVAQPTPQKTALTQPTPQKTVVAQKTPQKTEVAQKTPQNVSANNFSATKPANTTETIQNTTVAQQNATVAQQNTNVAKPNATVAKQNTTVAKPNATVAKPNATVAKRNATVAQQNTNVAKPSTTVAKQNTAVAKQNTTVDKQNTTETKPITKIEVSNCDENIKLLKNNEGTSQVGKSQLNEDVNEKTLQNKDTIGSQDIAEFLADGIIVDECMGSEDE